MTAVPRPAFDDYVTMPPAADTDVTADEVVAFYRGITFTG
jgi:hypothetical protein